MTGKAWFDDLTLTTDEFAPRIDSKYLYFILEKTDLSRISTSNFNRWLDHLDRAYEKYEELVGAVPYNGEKIAIISVQHWHESRGNVFLLKIKLPLVLYRVRVK